MWREVASFEWRVQRRDFLTWVYVAVFFLLCFGYTSSDAVELVRGREGVPRNAPWALAHAMAGVTAFGQVMTTMITATAVMRDVAARTQELLFTTRLTRAAYLAGRWAGALLMMLAVYAALPAGLVAGTMMPWVERGTLLPFDAAAYARPLLMLVAPNVLVVSALFFSAGAMRRGFMAILLLGVTLVTLWVTGVAMARDGVTWGALVDPFGNAALELDTHYWSVAERGALHVPADGWLLANRVLWLAIGVGALAWLARSFRFGLAEQPERPGARDGAAPPVAVTPPILEAPSASIPAAVATEARWTLRWTLRERGFLTLAALGALNALANAWRAGGAGGAGPEAGEVLASVHEHARPFLILVATIYAGELVWRERDTRADELRDALPVPTAALLTGKLLGLLAAQLLLVAPLLAAALLAGFARGASGMSLPLAALWIGGFTFPFLAQLTLLSLLVHAIVQHKVAGHVALIAGWVAAVAAERTLALPALWRFASLPAFTWDAAEGFGGAGRRLSWTVGYWSAVAFACAVVASAFWVRGAMPPLPERLRGALHGMRGRRGPLLLAAAGAAAVAGWRASLP